MFKKATSVHHVNHSTRRELEKGLYDDLGEVEEGETGLEGRMLEGG